MTVTDESANPDTDGPKPIQAVPLKHPGQWIAGAVILILVGLFVYGAATNDAYRWDTYAKYLFEERILSGVGYTLALTVLAMLAGVVLGVIVAVMRMSPNKVLSATAWVYLWVFRGTPVFVQLVLWGLVGSLYKVINIGVPFGPTFVQIDIQQLSPSTSSCSPSSGWRSTRRPTWPRSSAQASHRWGRADGGVHRARHVVVADHATHGPSPGDARHHSADRQ